MTGNLAVNVERALARGRVRTGLRAVLAVSDRQGVACSVCPDAVLSADTVNPLLGALVLGGAAEQDFSLPGVLPLAWQRRYCSHVDAERGGECGPLGHGWRTPLDMRLEVKEHACVLHDVQGRTITFGPLPAGGRRYSASEGWWLLRSGCDESPGGAPPRWQSAPEKRFAHVPPDLAQRPHVIFLGDSTGDVLWAFAPGNRKAIEKGDDLVPASDWLPMGCIDRLGRTQRLRYADVLGQHRLTSVQDGVGRRFVLRYQKVHAAHAEPRYPAGHFWQPDNGVRLAEVLCSELAAGDAEAALQPASPQSLDPAAWNRLVSYAYSPAGDLIEVRDGHGRCMQRFAYQNHLMVMHQDLEGPRHHYRYDRYEPGARVVQKSSDEGLTHRFSYQTLAAEDGEPRSRTTVQDSIQRTQGYLFRGLAGLARLVEHSHANGSITRMRYGAHGHLISSTDALGRTTRRVIDTQGRLLRERFPDGSENRFDRDPATGLLRRSVDAQGRATCHDYDAWHRLTRVTHPDAGTVRYAYPDPGHEILTAHLPREIIDAAGGVRRLEYTREGLLKSRRDGSGRVTEFQYTACGRLARVTDPLSQSTRYLYDVHSRLQCVIRHDGSKEQYVRNGGGQVTQLLGSSGNVIKEFGYDLWGRLVELRQAGRVQKFEYDTAGRLATHTNPGAEQAHWQWDEMDRVARHIGVDARVRSFVYDACGQLIQWSDGSLNEQQYPQNISRLEWNAMGRPVRRIQPGVHAGDAWISRFAWSGTGELRSASLCERHCGGGPQNAHDEQDRLLSHVRFMHDRLGRVTSEHQRLFNPKSGKLEYRFDIRHRLDRLGRRLGTELEDIGTIGYLRDGFGPVDVINWNGVRQVYFERDALQREISRHILGADLTRITQWYDSGQWLHTQWRGDCIPANAPAVIAAALSTQHFQHDGRGRISAIRGNVGISRFVHDAEGRLTAAHTPQAGLQRWSFDHAGNPLPQPSEDMTKEFAHATHAGPPREDDMKRMATALLCAPSLGTERLTELELAHTSRWKGNRVLYYVNAHDHAAPEIRLQYAYDGRGNCTRLRELHTRREIRMAYGADNRPANLRMMGPDGKTVTQDIRHDALGRRIASHIMDEAGNRLSTEYVGWDGALPVRMERHRYTANAPSSFELIHTVHEPDSNVPLMQLHRHTQAGRQLPALLRKRQAPPSQRIAQGAPSCLTGQPDGAFAATHCNEGAKGPSDLQLLHFLIDHQGAPVGMVNANGKVVWAMFHDACGNDVYVHDPLNLHQPCRSAGKLLDEHSGLRWDLHGLFDARIGRALNRAPQGLFPCLGIPGMEELLPPELRGLHDAAGPGWTGVPDPEPDPEHFLSAKASQPPE